MTTSEIDPISGETVTVETGVGADFCLDEKRETWDEAPREHQQ